MGYSSIYVDCVSGNLLQNSMDLTDKIAHKNGFFYFKSFCGTPLYRQGISVDFPENSILVYDYGTDFSNSDLSMMDQVLVVCSGNFWNIHNSINLITSLNNLISPVDYICNLCSLRLQKFLVIIFIIFLLIRMYLTIQIKKKSSFSHCLIKEVLYNHFFEKKVYYGFTANNWGMRLWT